MPETTPAEPEWLNTGEVAALLGVSEASVRRWSDAGRLPVRRLGGRRERRFRREDVERFDQQRPAAARGAEYFPLSPPAHLATFYQSDAGRFRVSGPFLSEGIARGEGCFLIADDDVQAAYSGWLRTAGADVDEAVKRQQLSLIKSPGRTVATAIRFLEDTLWATLERGAQRLRLVGETASVRDGFESAKAFFEFEAAADLMFRRFPCAVVCQYDVRRFSGEGMLAALRAHPDVFKQPWGAFLD